LSIGERELWAAIDRLRESMGEHHGTGLPAWEKWGEENGVDWEDLRTVANAYLPSFKTWLDESCLAEAAVGMWLHAFQVGLLAGRTEACEALESKEAVKAGEDVLREAAAARPQWAGAVIAAVANTVFKDRAAK
jgi:hypothetical protein